LKILIVDDSPEMVEAVRKTLVDQFEVVGVCEDGFSAVREAPGLNPDLIILDVSMPGMTGFEVAKKLAQLKVRAKIIFLSVHMDPSYIEAALEVGAFGYVFKSRLSADLLVAIKSVMEGGKFTSSPS
jgi:DNA-binding NarL/FixJ family response regulator